MAVVQVNGVLLARQAEKLSTITSSLGFTATKIQVNANNRLVHAEEALATVETAAIRWTCDGTTPTVSAGSGIGHLANAGDVLAIVGVDNIKNFRAINDVAGNNAAVMATFFFKQ